MFLADNDTISVKAPVDTARICYHCGAACITDKIRVGKNIFCCQGCKLVYELLEEKGLCDYYTLQSHPGLSQIKPITREKYAYLEDENIANKLCNFRSERYTIVTLYIPSVHCSSCMWLLEHLDRLDPAITESRINFSAKEITVRFLSADISLRRVVELLATIGYEPYISLDDVSEHDVSAGNKSRLMKLGIAGFCFGNIMMMSFPEYLSGGDNIDPLLTSLFRYLSLLLSLPVFFYSATEFYSAAWAGIKQKMLNIDAPIVVALVITFGRSVYEILSGAGSGYLDSMSGIVFFMLVGRIVQERTYKYLTFTRDYKAYFPIAVSVKTDAGIVKKQLKDLQRDDTVILNNGEIIPSDSQVVSDGGNIDYSFVTGEADPVRVVKDEFVYAGGKLLGGTLTVRVIKPITASYLTSLWNHKTFEKNKVRTNDRDSTVHVLSRYFTVILFSLATITAIYWAIYDSSKIVTSISAMLIVACPCALLLASTFTNSNVLRIFSLNGFYLRDASVIEQMTKLDAVVFDKTGTITTDSIAAIRYEGHGLNDNEKQLLYAAVSQSNHPSSMALRKWLGEQPLLTLDEWEEVPGEGIDARVDSTHLRVGNFQFAGNGTKTGEKAAVYVSINGAVTAFYFEASVRPGIKGAIQKLSGKYSLSMLSGDHDKQRAMLAGVFGAKHTFCFEQKPIDKLRYIEQLQNEGRQVAMIGDGLNDAGALQQSNVGIAVADDINSFTPASDAILDAGNITSLPSFLDFARESSVIINISFVVSIVYNVAGLYFAMRGQMLPVVAAILMPCSTISIVILSSGLSNFLAWRKGLHIKAA